MFSKQQVPHGGWKFFEKQTNITLVAFSMDKLVAHIKSHRKSNAIPEGNPELEIEEQLKQNDTQSK